MARAAWPQKLFAPPSLGQAVYPVTLANAALLLLLAKGPASLALALALIGPVVVAVLQRPQRGLLLLAALAPLDGLLVVLQAPGFVSGWKHALVAFVLAATFLCPPEAKGQSAARRPGWVPGLLALFVLGLASAAVVGDRQALVGLRLTFFYTLVAWAAWRCPLDRSERDRLITILMATGFVAAVFGLVQQRMGHAWLISLGYEYDRHVRTAGGVLRSIGTFQQPFGLGFYMMLVLLVGIPVVASETRRLRSVLFLIAVPVYAMAMFASLVRAAWIGCVVGIVFLGWRRLPALLLLLPPALLALPFVPAEVGSAALSPSSFEQRTVAWGENAEQVLQHPLGVGIGSSGSAVDKASKGETAPDFVPDNYYVKTVFDLGIVGLWLFVLVVAAVFASVRNVAAGRSGPEEAFAAGVTTMVVAAAVAATVATYFEMFPMDLFFWLLVGVAESTRRSPLEPAAIR